MKSRLLKMALTCLAVLGLCSMDCFADDFYIEWSDADNNYMVFRLSPELESAEFCGVSKAWNQQKLTIPKQITADGITYPVRSVAGLANNRYNWSSNSYIKEISIPSSVKVLDHHAFSSYPLVRKIAIPDSVVIVDKLAFYNCTNLTELVIEDGNEPVWFRDCYTQNNVKYATPYSQTADIFETNSDAYWFDGCVNLSYIHIGRDIVIEGREEWSENGYYLPESNIITRSRDLFSNYSNIKYLEFGNGVTDIPAYILSDIRQLTQRLGVSLTMHTLYIPASVTHIAPGALSLLKDSDIKVEVDSDNPCFYSPSGSNVIVERATGSVVWGAGDAIIPSDATSIADLAFFGSGINTITVPSSVKSIGNFAFAFCRNLENVNFSGSLEYLGQGAFMLCDKLKEMNIPAGVANLNGLTFYRCLSLKKINVPASLESFDFWDFTILPSLGEISFAGTLPEYRLNYSPVSENEVYTGVLEGGYLPQFIPYDYNKYLTLTLTGEGYMLSGSKGLNSIQTLFGWVDYLGTNLLEKHTTQNYSTDYLKSELIGNNDFHINIGSVADYFHGNSMGNKLARAFFPVRCFRFGGKAFDGTLAIPEGTANLSKINASEYSETNSPSYLNLIVPYSLETVDDIVSCKIDTVFIPSSLKLDNGCFSRYGAKYFVSIGQLPQDGSCDITYNEDMTELIRCNVGIEGTLEIPATVRRIADLAFNGQNRLESLTMPGVKKIGTGAFNGCSGLKTVSMPVVSEIGNSAFSGCSSLETVVIPDSCNVGSYAFENCSALEKVIVKGTLREYGRNPYFSWTAFTGCERLVSAGQAGSGANIELEWQVWPSDLFDIFPYIRNVSIAGQALSYYDGNRFNDPNHDIFPSSLEIARLTVDYSQNNKIVTLNPDTGYVSENDWDESLLASDAVNVLEVEITGGVFAVKSATAFSKVRKLTFGPNAIGFDPYSIETMSALEEFACSPSNRRFKALDGVLFSNDGDTLFSFPPAKGGSYEIPSGTKVIAQGAFCASSLKSLVIPSSVTDIDGHAFDGCRSLATLRLESTAAISACTFVGCTSLQDIIVTSAAPAVLDVSQYPLPVTFRAEDVFNGSTANTAICSKVYNPMAVGNFVWQMTGRNATGPYMTDFDIPKNLLQSGEYDFYLAITPNLAVGKPNLIMPTIKYIHQNNEVILLQPTVKNSRRTVRTTFENSMEKIDSMKIGRVIIPADSVVYNNQIHVLVETNISSNNIKNYTNQILLDEMLFCPTDSSDARYNGPFSYGTFADAHLHVPSGQADSYRSAPGWNMFGNVIDDASTFVPEPEKVKVSVEAEFHSTYNGTPDDGNSHVSVTGENYSSDTGEAVLNSTLVAEADDVPGFVFSSWNLGILSYNDEIANPFEFEASRNIMLTGHYFMTGDLNSDNTISIEDKYLWNALVKNTNEGGINQRYMIMQHSVNEEGTNMFILYFYNTGKYMTLTDRNFDIDNNGKIDWFDYYALWAHADKGDGLILPSDQSIPTPEVSFSFNDLTFDNISHFSEIPLTLSWERSKDARIRYMEFDLDIPDTGHGMEIIANGCTVLESENGHYRLELIPAEHDGKEPLLQFIFPDVGITSYHTSIRNVFLFDENCGTFQVQDAEGLVLNPTDVETQRYDLSRPDIYDIVGRSVESPQHGLFIINGKLVFIK